MDKETIISKNILENMSDGVMTIDLKGDIITFNSSAGQILGLIKEDVLGKKFAEVFLEYEGNDAFNQLILDAIYESSISHNRIIDFNTGNKIISLSLTTSYLQSTESGSINKVGVIAVFNDITEIKELRDTEIHLTEEIKGKHKELQDAYLKIEESNKDLESALKKVQMVRITATAFIIILFLGIGLFIWNKKHIAVKREEIQKGEPQIIKIAPQPVSFSITMTGYLEPLNVINITCPLSGRVQEVYARYGEIVNEGQKILKMDASEVEQKLRDAKAAYIKASEQFKSLENWENSADVARAKRSLTKAKLNLDSQKKELEETERLFNKGIVPATESEGAKQQYISQQLDYQTAQEELQAILEKGNEKNKNIARLEMDNAHSKLKELELQLKQSSVTATVSGVIIMPTATGDDKNVKKVEKGSSFQQGDIMFSIGNLSGFAVRSKVDEIDLVKIQEDQKVKVTGDAFPSITLNGKIYKISSQATKASGSSESEGGGGPSFEIVVNIDELTPELRNKIFIGMSANLEIFIYEKPDALMVPVSAVEMEGNRRFIYKRSAAGTGSKVISERVEVQTGYTTIDSVEIIKGLTAGNEIEIR
jgi:PAS domain S-box-containing protein